MDLIRTDHDGAALYTAGNGKVPTGYVAIHTTVAGRSCGGLRMLPDVEAEELRLLAESMTLKYGFLGLPQGGAKAGLRGDPEAPQPQRENLLAEFAQAIAPLLRSRTYIPGSDMGTDADDIRFLLRSARVRVPPRQLRQTRSGLYTAVSVLAAARASVRHLGIDLAGLTAAIEGFGHVGAPLAGLLAEQGVRVVAISTQRGAIYNPKGLDVERLLGLSQSAGSGVVAAYADAQRLDRRTLVELPADLLCPCARHHTIAAENAPRVRARIICPGANNPLTDPAEETLRARGVLCLPDFLTNCGGVLGGTMEFAAIGPEKIVAFIRQWLEQAVAAVLTESARQGLAPRALARKVALERFGTVKAQAERPSPAGRLMGAGLALYRWGLLPRALVGRLAPGYFRSRLERYGTDVSGIL